MIFFPCFTLYLDRFLYLLKKATNPGTQLQTFANGKPEHVYFVPYRDPPNQKDSFSCADWMAMSAISCMRKAPRVSLANTSNNFAVLKGPWLSEDFVFSHRQLVALLVFALNNHAYDGIDLAARDKIKTELDCILLQLKPPSTPIVVDLCPYATIPETIAQMTQRIEGLSINDGLVDGEVNLKYFFHRKLRTGSRFSFYRNRRMNMLRNCSFRYYSFPYFSSFNFIFAHFNIRCPMNSAMFAVAAALPTNYFAKLSMLDVNEMDTLSYYLIRELICLRVSNVSNVVTDFLVGNNWLPSTPLTLQLWEIAASETEIRYEGEHDLYRDVSEMMAILFVERQRIFPLVKGIFQPFVKLECSDGAFAHTYNLQDLVSSHPETDAPMSDAPLVSFEIGTELSATHSVFSMVYGADLYIRGLGKKEWVHESAKAFLEIIHAKGANKTWQDMAKFQTIASLFIKNTIAAKHATEALAVDAEALAVDEEVEEEGAAKSAAAEEKTSKALLARQNATAAAVVADTIFEIPFLLGYNDGDVLVESMMPAITAYGIELAVRLQMHQWGKDVKGQKIRGEIQENIPIELLELYPRNPDPKPMEDLPDLSPQDAVVILANLFLRVVEGKQTATVVDCVYLQALSVVQKRQFPLLCLPENLQVTYKGEELDVVSVIDMHGVHFTTHVLSLNFSGGIETTMYDDTRSSPSRSRNINKQRTMKNIVRVICARLIPFASGRHSLVSVEMEVTSGASGGVGLKGRILRFNTKTIGAQTEPQSGGEALADPREDKISSIADAGGCVLGAEDAPSQGKVMKIYVQDADSFMTLTINSNRVA